MTRLTEEQITQKAREAGLAAITPRLVALGHEEEAGSEIGKAIHRAARAAIIATLTEYAPHLLPRDPDEELAIKLTEGWVGEKPDGLRYTDLALYVIKHMRESGK